MIVCFNPRTRVGCDLALPLDLLWIDVSIHAPAWGATSDARTRSRLDVFQSTHPRGVRRGRSGTIDYSGGFNPRTRVGCDFKFVLLAAVQGGFNPRTRVGCDLRELGDAARWTVSIHAPAWGATCSLSSWTVGQAFQSTHPRGVRLIYR